jgi:hypothetical protein
MAQFKEYVENDFLYSRYTTFDGTKCNTRDVYTGPIPTDLTQPLLNALCVNKKYAKTIMNNTQSHPGADQRYVDAQGFSDTSMLNIFNLGIGIVGAAIFISKTYK